MGKKGVSYEEKRRRILQIFYDHKEVFHLKELEKLGPKKGVVLQSVKDVVQSLVSDGYVQSEKIGSGVYFWALPSKASEQRKKCLQINKTQASNLLKQNEELEGKLEEAKERTKEDDPQEREELKEQLKLLKEDRDTLQHELSKFEKNAPERLQELKEEEKQLKTKGNLWVDNLFLVQQYLKKIRPDLRSEDWEKNFPVLKDLDYIE